MKNNKQGNQNLITAPMTTSLNPTNPANLQSTIIQRQYKKNASKQRSLNFNQAAKAANMQPQKFADHVIANAANHSQQMVSHAKAFKNNPNALISE